MFLCRHPAWDVLAIRSHLCSRSQVLLMMRHTRSGDQVSQHMEHVLARLRLAFFLEEHHLKLLFSQPIDWMEDAPWPNLLPIGALCEVTTLFPLAIDVRQAYGKWHGTSKTDSPFSCPVVGQLIGYDVQLQHLVTLGKPCQTMACQSWSDSVRLKCIGVWHHRISSMYQMMDHWWQTMRSWCVFSPSHNMRDENHLCTLRSVDFDEFRWISTDFDGFRRVSTGSNISWTYIGIMLYHRNHIIQHTIHLQFGWYVVNMLLKYDINIKVICVEIHRNPSKSIEIHQTNGLVWNMILIRQHTFGVITFCMHRRLHHLSYICFAAQSCGSTVGLVVVYGTKGETGEHVCTKERWRDGWAG